MNLIRTTEVMSILHGVLIPHVIPCFFCNFQKKIEHPTSCFIYKNVSDYEFLL